MRNGQGLADACTVSTLPWTSEDIPLAGGFFDEIDPLHVESEPHVFDSDVDSSLHFVAVVYDALDREVNRGVCGDPDETLGLKGHKVLLKGGDSIFGGIAALGAVTVLVGILVAAHARRARHR